MFHQGLMLLHSSVLPFSHFPNKLQLDVPDTNVWGKSARGSRCSSPTISLQVIPGFCIPLSRQIEATIPRLNRSTVLCFSSAITTTTVTPTTRTHLPCSSPHQPSPRCISIPCIRIPPLRDPSQGRKRKMQHEHAVILTAR